MSKHISVQSWTEQLIKQIDFTAHTVSPGNSRTKVWLLCKDLTPGNGQRIRLRISPDNDHLPPRTLYPQRGFYPNQTTDPSAGTYFQRHCPHCQGIAVLVISGPAPPSRFDCRTYTELHSALPHQQSPRSELFGTVDVARQHVILTISRTEVPVGVGIRIVFSMVCDTFSVIRTLCVKAVRTLSRLIIFRVGILV